MNRFAAWTIAVLLVATGWVVARGAPLTQGGAEPKGVGVVASLPATIPAGDLLLPMQEMIRRFQEPLPRVDKLGEGAAASRDALIDAFVAAVEDSSGARLRSLRLDVAEFAWLYFPESRYTAKPYELPPETLWMLIDQNGLKGERRLLRYFGGRPLGVSGYACEDEPRREGENSYWERCTITISGPDGPRRMRLFGSIMEREGRFKFVSMTNDL